MAQLLRTRLGPCDAEAWLRTYDSNTAASRPDASTMPPAVETQRSIRDRLSGDGVVDPSRVTKEVAPRAHQRRELLQRQEGLWGLDGAAARGVETEWRDRPYLLLSADGRDVRDENSLTGCDCLDIDYSIMPWTRHHACESLIQKGVSQAIRKAGSTKRVTCHAFCHSFTTHLLDDGYDVCTERELMGYRDLRMTMIYTRVLNHGGRGVRSPADILARRPDERY